MNIPAPRRNPAADVAALAQSLRALAQRPAARIALAGLEKALPEASALVRGAIADPAGTLGEMVAPLARAAAEELADADRVIAGTIARAFGRGVARGARKR